MNYHELPMNYHKLRGCVKIEIQSSYGREIQQIYKSKVLIDKMKDFG